MVTDINGNIISVNHAFTTITGYRAEEVIGRKPSILNSGKQDEEFYQVFWQSLREHGGWNGRLQNRRKNGEVYTEWLSISATRDMDGLPQNYIAVFSDLSKLMATEQRLAFLAYHDSLTGLPNRLLLEDRLEQLLNFSRRNKESLTLIFIDLDLFKQVNDKHGHQAGDLVLKEVANRLQMSVRESDTVARLGGDEFVILAPRLVGNEEIKRFCNKALQYLVAPIVVNGMELYIGASFGCAEYERHGKDAVSLLNHADIAMYRAKLAGGNTCYIYEPKVAE
jgi:diguanylate cyclase (GGDEF)-like protein/PAS domain S-box-containing protein